MEARAGDLQALERVAFAGVESQRHDQRGRGERLDAGEGAGFNLNLPQPLGSGDGPWLAAGDIALARIREFAPTALVVALGLDASESDPLQGLKVTGAGFHAMAAKIGALGLPTVLVQEGGYLSEDLGRNLVQFLSGFA